MSIVACHEHVVHFSLCFPPREKTWVYHTRLGFSSYKFKPAFLELYFPPKMIRLLLPLLGRLIFAFIRFCNVSSIISNRFFYLKHFVSSMQIITWCKWYERNEHHGWAIFEILFSLRMSMQCTDDECVAHNVDATDRVRFRLTFNETINVCAVVYLSLKKRCIPIQLFTYI